MTFIRRAVSGIALLAMLVIAGLYLPAPVSTAAWIIPGLLALALLLPLALALVNISRMTMTAGSAMSWEPGSSGARWNGRGCCWAGCSAPATASPAAADPAIPPPAMPPVTRLLRRNRHPTPH